MKPVLIFVLDNGDKVTMTKEQLEKLVADVYEQGKADAPKYALTDSGTWITRPNPVYSGGTSDPSLYERVEVTTCTQGYTGSLDKLDMT